MKTKIFILLFILGAGLTAVSCSNDIESETIQKPYTYSDLYYQNLRDYKASDHSIAFGWFADYTQHHSLALRFMGLPDSLDICSLWGGIPCLNPNDSDAFCDTIAYNEMRYVQKTKGTKMVVPTIIRIEDGVKYGNKDFYKLFRHSYDDATLSDDDALAMRHKALELYADYLLRPILEYDLDGIDLDYEPEGDRLSGENMDYFVKYIAKFVGPDSASANKDKMLIIDYYSAQPSSNTLRYTSYYVNQTYGGFPGETCAGAPYEKMIYTENIGDNWQTGGQLLTYAKWQPATGRKGGFGAFYMHRDYNLDPPYKYMRMGIQLQNPAIR
jgi:hypothetical protein